jgi:class 3 adenylate cyclase
LPPERRIELRVGIHVGDIVENADGDLTGHGVSVRARWKLSRVNGLKKQKIGSGEQTRAEGASYIAVQ